MKKENILLNKAITFAKRIVKPHKHLAKEKREGIANPLDLNKLAVCDECGSTYYEKSSAMRSLCPECAHVLYGCPPCEHIFVGKRCEKCYWDSSRSKYVKFLCRKKN